MVCRSMLASDSGEMDSALFLLSRGVNRGLEKRDTGETQKDTVGDNVSHLGIATSTDSFKRNQPRDTTVSAHS